jgi:hypothetical protein
MTQIKKINVAELLKDCPKGMELDCAMYSKVTLLRVDDDSGILYPIKVVLADGGVVSFTKYGEYKIAHFAKCVIFPKGKTTWDGFVPPCKFKDGDIVAIGTDGGTQVFIFKEYIDTEMNYAHCYMMLDDDGAIYFEGDDYYVERLATEEEKQKLFKAIKDNGYKWNPETKISEKLVEPKFKVGDRIRSIISSSYYTIVDIKNDQYFIKSNDAEKFPYHVPFSCETNYELVPNKFDINTLVPFKSRVLARDNNTEKWKSNFWGFYDIDNAMKCPYECCGCEFAQCIPYEGNEHLLGTTNDCDEFYKTWEE